MLLKTNKFKFDEFLFDAQEKVLFREGKPVSITPKVFELLLVLIENHGHLVEKNELIKKVWADSFVEDGNLAYTMRLLRIALGDDKQNPRFIETVSRRGYRFIAEVREITEENVLNNNFKLIEKNSADSLKFKNFLIPVAAVLIIGIIFAGFWLAKSKIVEAAAPVLSAPFASEKLSTNGKVLRAVISPDGKTVVYTNGIEGKQSVWLRQLESANNVEIIPPSDDFYYGLELSPDSNFLYFVRAPKSVARQFDIYRVSIFGGIPTKIIGDADGWISISPDGANISFVRCYYRDDDYCSLWIADALDGKNERKIVSRPRPFRIGDNQISPDGKTIAFAVGQSETQANEFSLSEVNIENGQERELTTEKFFNIRSLAWLPDREGLLLVASRVPNKQYRIWQISADSGKAVTLTKDSETYWELSLDKAASRLVATQTKQDFRLHLLNLENPSVKRVLADASGVSFAPDGKIIFSSLMTGNDEIWSINADGSGQRQLTNNPADEYVSVVSPDGNSIFFSSNRTGETHVWRMNADGSNQTQITQKTGGFPLSVTPDGNWLYYHHNLTKTLWRISLINGAEELILDKRIHQLAISLDGLQAAFLEKQGTENILIIISLADLKTVKTFKLATEKADLIQLKWSPDGENLAYILAAAEFENKILWFQNLDGKPPRQIADLGNERMVGFGLALAPDGKSFAVVQGGWQHDAVLLKGLR